jgi:hypothetical protein
VALATPRSEPEALEPPAIAGEIGVDVGGAASFEELRALWTSTRGRNAALVEGLQKVVAARENGKARTVDLRLVLGPLTDVEAAVRLCVKLKPPGRTCELAQFKGEPFAPASAEPLRKPPSSTEPPRKPPAKDRKSAQSQTGSAKGRQQQAEPIPEPPEPVPTPPKSRSPR